MASQPAGIPANVPAPALDEVEEGKAALVEATAVASGVDLSNREDLNRFNRLLRSDAVDRHWHCVLVIGLYFVGVCAALIFGVIVWNMLVATPWRFLDPTQLAALQTFLFSGALGSGVTVAAKKITGKS